MFIEKWKDTAFGSDYGGDFAKFLERIPTETLTMTEIFKYCDLKKYFDNSELLNQRTDNNVKIENTEFEQYVHYEDAVIVLCAIAVENEVSGIVDLTNAYGSKKLKFNFSKDELVLLRNVLKYICENPDRFVLFEMCLDEESDETIKDLKEIIVELEKCIKNKV